MNTEQVAPASDIRCTDNTIGETHLDQQPVTEIYVSHSKIYLDSTPVRFPFPPPSSSVRPRTLHTRQPTPPTRRERNIATHVRTSVLSEHPPSFCSPREVPWRVARLGRFFCTTRYPRMW